MKKEKLKELASPLLKYLNEEGHPHMTIIITPTSVELLESSIVVGNIDDYLEGE